MKEIVGLKRKAFCHVTTRSQSKGLEVVKEVGEGKKPSRSAKKKERWVVAPRPVPQVKEAALDPVVEEVDPVDVGEVAATEVVVEEAPADEVENADNDESVEVEEKGRMYPCENSRELAKMVDLEQHSSMDKTVRVVATVKVLFMAWKRKEKPVSTIKEGVLVEKRRLTLMLKDRDEGQDTIFRMAQVDLDLRSFNKLSVYRDKPPCDEWEVRE